MTKGAAPSPRVPAAPATERVCPTVFSIVPYSCKYLRGLSAFGATRQSREKGAL